MTLPTIDALKDQAKRLRTALENSGQRSSHSASLELVARQHGFKDWNALSARARVNAPPPPFSVGQRVRGAYLGQPFTGRIRGVAAMSGDSQFRLTVEFDEAVDVVTFESFSAFRKRVNVVVDRAGVSPKKRSDGVPHLKLAL